MPKKPKRKPTDQPPLVIADEPVDHEVRKVRGRAIGLEKTVFTEAEGREILAFIDRADKDKEVYPRKVRPVDPRVYRPHDLILNGDGHRAMDEAMDEAIERDGWRNDGS